MQLIAIFFLALPWLNPLAPGPSPGVVPWLVSLAAAAALVCLAPLRAVSGQPLSEASFAQRWVAAAAWAWLLAGLLSSLIGLLQYFGATAALGAWVSQTPAPGEAFANLRQRNQFASLTNIALAALIWVASRRGTDGPRQWLVYLGAFLLAIGNAASSSRAGLLELVVLCVLAGIWGAWRQPPVLRLLLTAVLAYAVATLALPWLLGLDPAAHGMLARLRGGELACASRMVLWSNVLDLIALKPWLGWGWGELDYAHYATLYAGPRFCEILDNAHNLPLHLAVELGIPVALLVCGLGGWWVVRRRPWRETDAARQLAWSVLAVILLHSLLEYPLWYGPFQIAFGLCVGLLWRGSDDAPVSGVPRALVLRRLLAAAAMVCCAYAAWDYHRVSQIYLAPQDRSAAYRDGTLAKIRDSWLFRNQVSFAELNLTPLTRDNARWTYDTATALLHYSPEPSMIEKVIESAVMLGLDDEALMHLARFRAAFPKEHARWAAAKAGIPEGVERLP
ncbi:lipid A core-O-antigen ligase-like enyme [Polaromonas sp. CF318]|uniref:PglL family O-oligosaccharyltransferase n=1 Tax=Polaromonas sp. CF318 TaxID=1144318 RepID=UPI00027144C5|nr:Wzy polymerase domain-containing protein [Polaromonas sp. CF318]EJL82715.1 lipid A core-O-antigen ligase-like enyme [Polaromonas sp. CF318]